MMRYATCHPDRKLYCKGACKPCYMLAWRAAHPTWDRDNYWSNPESGRARSHKWRAENPDKVRAAMRRWRAAARAADPERFRSAERTKRQSRRASCVAYTPNPATAAQRAALVATGEVCLYCESAQAEHVDHFIPLSRWGEVELPADRRAAGPDHISNLVGACAACNLAKNNRIPDLEWRGRTKR